jgi:hypothetical protein
MLKLSLVVIVAATTLLLLICTTPAAAQSYAAAIKALEYVNAKLPMQVIVYGGEKKDKGERGLFVNMNSDYSELLISDRDVSNCGYNNYQCTYSAFTYLKQVLENRGYKMHSFTDFTIQNTNPRKYSGRADFLRFIR